MSPELDKKLCEKYPKIFSLRYGDMKDTAMCWGFEHDDGWYNIIDRLCANIQSHIDWSHKSHQFDILPIGHPLRIHLIPPQSTVL